MNVHATIIQAAVDRVQAALNRPRSAEEEARAQIQLAKGALAHRRELRAYDMRCFPGFYGRDYGPSLKASASLLALCAFRRRRVAELRARASLPSIQKKAA